MPILRKQVHYHQYTIGRVRYRETLHKVHRDHLPSRIGDWQWMEKTRCLGIVIFGLMTDSTRLYKLLHDSFHSRLSKALLKPHVYNRHPRMSSLSASMKFTNQALLQSQILTDPYTVAIPEKTRAESEIGYCCRIRGQL